MASPVRLLTRLAFAALILASARSGAFALGPAPETGLCSLEGATPATAVAIDADFAIGLDDGRRIALSGLELPPPPSYRQEPAQLRERLAAWLVGKQVFVGVLAEHPDRWGRAPARLFAAVSEEQASPLVSVGVALLESGAARYRPDRRAASCAVMFLAAEAAARASDAGLWADPALLPVVLPSDAAATLPGGKGMMIVEGVVRSTGKTAGAFYLNLGDARSGGFAVVISRRISYKNFPSGFDPTQVVGRRVRVRGLIETGFGPRLEIAYPEEIEFIDAP